MRELTSTASGIINPENPSGRVISMTGSDEVFLGAVLEADDFFRGIP